jgi:CHAT domain-containing protein
MVATQYATVIPIFTSVKEPAMKGISQPDPFADAANQPMLERFGELLENYDLDGYAGFLVQQRQLLDYYEAILWVERSRWDQAEQLLQTLLQQTLHPKLEIRVLNVLAIVQEHLGQLLRAVDTYSRSLAALGPDDPLYAAKVRKNRAICIIRAYEAGLVGSDRLATARHEIEQAIQTFNTTQERHLEGKAWNELGASYKAEAKWPDAIRCYQREREICTDIGDHYGQACALNNLGEAFVAEGRFAEAHPLLRQAVDLFQTLRDPYEEADALANLGNALAGLGEDVAAEEAFERSLHQIESIRERLVAETARTDFFATQTHVYSARVAHALQQKESSAAFNITERARARSLLELIGNPPLQPPDTIPPDLLAREQRLRDQLIEGSGEAKVEDELNDLYRQLQFLAPGYTSLKTVLPLQASEIVARLPSDTALLSYFTVGDSIVGFVLSPDRGVHSVELPLSMADLAAASFDSFGRVRSLLPADSPQLPHPWLLERLHTALFKPLLPYCQGHRRLVFVPHGALHLLPLHAMRDPQGSGYLSEQFDIVYAPSASILVEHLQSRASDAARAGALSAAFAPPHELPHARREAVAIVDLMGGRALLDTEATQVNILNQARRHHYLHIAAHGRFSASAPLTSGLLLADGALTAWDLLQTTPLGLELVTLSACDTGRNQVQRGDELLGLLRALLYAAAPSVLLTLWKVEDLSARLFMQTFYEKLAARSAQTSISKVLRESIARFRRLTAAEVRALLRQDGLAATEIEAILSRLPKRPGDTLSLAPQDGDYIFDHPYFWAPFVLVGERWST